MYPRDYSTGDEDNCSCMSAPCTHRDDGDGYPQDDDSATEEWPPACEIRSEHGPSGWHRDRPRGGAALGAGPRKVVGPQDTALRAWIHLHPGVTLDRLLPADPRALARWRSYGWSVEKRNGRVRVRGGE